MSDHSGDDGHYQLEEDDGDEHQAVAVGAPFLALETSDKSSVASSSYSDTSVPSKMVVLPIGRNLARNLEYHDGYVFLEPSVPLITLEPSIQSCNRNEGHIL